MSNRHRFYQNLSTVPHSLGIKSKIFNQAYKDFSCLLLNLTPLPFPKLQPLRSFCFSINKAVSHSGSQPHWSSYLNTLPLILLLTSTFHLSVRLVPPWRQRPRTLSPPWITASLFLPQHFSQCVNCLSVYTVSPPRSNTLIFLNKLLNIN